eukprot:TRINITY_DN12095_c1_g3_i2.p1 TRINITY_DN12095_c1_g3~~TRINITY_DN12095_c1_g3_i2.p1  ORF type:complete len:424 (+),score=129.59 TRINITY_DN12095_c1_g3_i2:107-1378(+)
MPRQRKRKAATAEAPSKVAKLEIPVMSEFDRADQFTVYTSEDGLAYSFTSEQDTKFYRLQLLEAKAGNGFVTFAHWGRVGGKGQSQVVKEGSLATTKKAFEKKFLDKTKNRWGPDIQSTFTAVEGKYDLVQIEDDGNGNDDDDDDDDDDNIEGDDNNGDDESSAKQEEDKFDLIRWGALGAAIASTERPVIAGQLTGQTASNLTSSFLGGQPWWPKGMEYPTYEGNPMAFLLQINLEQMPKHPDLPEAGLLQVFFGDPDEFASFRCVYHADSSKEVIATPPNAELSVGENPLLDDPGIAKAIEFTSGKTIMKSVDYRFETLVTPHLASEEQLDEYCDEELDKDTTFLEDEDGSYFLEIGGHADFTQDDPRGDGDDVYGDFTLMKLEADDGGLRFDDGVACIFMPVEDVKKRDFSRAKLYFDCS